MLRGNMDKIVQTSNSSCRAGPGIQRAGEWEARAAYLALAARWTPAPGRC